jgi:hypothetical protein
MERRSRARVNAPELLFNAWEEGWPTACRVIDVSEHGLRVERMFRRRRDVSQDLVLELELPGGDIVKIPAVRAREDGTSQFFARFVGTSDNQKRLVKGLMSRRAATV